MTVNDSEMYVFLYGLTIGLFTVFTTRSSALVLAVVVPTDYLQFLGGSRRYTLIGPNQADIDSTLCIAGS